MNNVITIKGAGSGSGATRSAQQKARGTKRNPFKAGSARATKFKQLTNAQATVNDPNKGARAKTRARNILRAQSITARSNVTAVRAAASKRGALKTTPTPKTKVRRTQRG